VVRLAAKGLTGLTIMMPIRGSPSEKLCAATLDGHTRQQGHKFITTNYILTQLVALLLSPLRIPRPRLTAFIEGLKASPHVEIVHVDPTLDAQAWQLFTERPDKE
jgi:hypothetical protein